MQGAGAGLRGAGAQPSRSLPAAALKQTLEQRGQADAQCILAHATGASMQRSAAVR